MAEREIALICGVGPEKGMGAQLCHRFSKAGLYVVASGRTESDLQEVVNSVEKSGGDASYFVADATSEKDTAELFNYCKTIGCLNLAIYNAGNNTPGRILDISPAYFKESWKVCCFGGFLFGQAATKLFISQSTGGTLIFTGASASLRGRENFGAFNSSKAALRAFAQALAKEHGKDDIHVGHVVIDGAINGEKIHTRYPEFAKEMGSGGLLNLSSIVDVYEFLWKQPKSGWSFEIDCRTNVESW